jgi:hypothetical protein
MKFHASSGAMQQADSGHHQTDWEVPVREQ